MALPLVNDLLLHAVSGKLRLLLLEGLHLDDGQPRLLLLAVCHLLGRTDSPWRGTRLRYCG
jgi:hypothetical protein